MAFDGYPPATSVADVAEKLMSEFGALLSPAIVSRVVLDALRDLTGQVPSAALTELLYRLARQRLSGAHPD